MGLFLVVRDAVTGEAVESEIISLKDEQGVPLQDRLTQMNNRIEDAESKLDIVDLNRLIAALSGSLQLVLDSNGEDITAAELNGGAAGTVIRSFDVELQTIGGAELVHEWAGLTPDITPSKGTVADGDVANPAIETAPPPAIRSGKMKVNVTFDTDGGATKTYVAAEEMTITIDVTGVGSMAYVANAVKTYTVT